MCPYVGGLKGRNVLLFFDNVVFLSPLIDHVYGLVFSLLPLFCNFDAWLPTRVYRVSCPKLFMMHMDKSQEPNNQSRIHSTLVSDWFVLTH